MLIFIYGLDTFRLSKKLAEIVEEYKRRKSGDFLTIDVSQESGEDFFAALGQNSLFQEKKFIVIKNPIANKDFKEKLLDQIDKVAKSGHNIIFSKQERC